ncbi:AAA family ATPase [Brevibacillus humidisoli]|uniref:ATP-binding protein n=1 Tax=Brevibacillus humidisoli TaxID=2895522 RepID=UPI001E434DB8|nr:AAA family ATPase [Brevibacillus humidisoli]UFJ39690.1 AAA family ATPase [Brevibacillus humidisoli]
MIIDELHVGGFGRWRDTTFSFVPGLNLFVAPNEAGKSTLLHALFAALYGMKRDYLRVTRYLDEYERYYPWDRGPYETIIRYQLDGQSFRLHRCHEKEREQARLFREPELTEITLLYQEDRRKEYNFLERHLGLTRTLFADVTWVRGGPVHAARHLLPTLVNDNEADPLVNALLAALEQEISVVGRKESAGSTLIGKLSGQLEQARSELEDAEASWQSVQHLTRSLAVWQDELNSEQTARIQIEAKMERIKQAEAAWQEKWQQSFETTTAAQITGWAESASDEQQERVLHHQTAEQLHALEQEIAQWRQSNVDKSRTSHSEAADRYLSFAGIDEAAWQQWLKDWYALSVYDERQVASDPEVDLNKLQSDYLIGQEWAKNVERLEKECERLASVIEETERTKREASITTPTAAQPTESPMETSPQDYLSRKNRAALARKRQASRHKWWWYGASLCVAAVGIISWWSDQQAAAVVAAVLTALAGLVGWYVSQNGQKAAPVVSSADTETPLARQDEVTSRLEARLYELEEELVGKQQELRKCQASLRQLLGEWNLSEWEAFLAMREKWLIQIHEHQLSEKEAAERKRIQMRLEKQMLEWGVPPHLPFEQAAALVLSEHAEWEQRSRAQQQRLQEELDDQKRRAARASRLAKLEQKQTEILERWRMEIRDILLSRQKELEQQRREAEAERAERDEAITTLREKIAQARGEIGQRGEVALAKAKSRYDDVKEKWEEVRLRRDALILAKSALEEAMEEWRTDISPQMNQTASRVVKQLTGGRYQDVRLDPLQDFAIRVVEPERRNIVEQSNFSSGTQDQLYFAQRIALLQKVSAEREPLPIFLDDHFIHYDQERLEAALYCLLELAESHQVFLFSCHRRELDYLQPMISGMERHKIHAWP